MLQTFLIIEDCPNDALFIERALREITATKTLVVKDANEAEAYLRGLGGYANRENFPYPIAVISDLHLMPRSGFEFLSWLRSADAFPLLPLFFLTGSLAPHDRDRAESFHGVYIFEKPLDTRELDCLMRIIVGHVVGRKDDSFMPRVVITSH